MTAAYPEWTECRKKNGLDPLGMQTGSVNVYQRLLPGISNVTLRIRYYGLYAWLARIYAKDIGDTDPISWQRFVRRAEALYALVAQQKGNETGVAGAEWASRVLENSNVTELDFAAAAEPGSTDYYLKQTWGAYGAGAALPCLAPRRAFLHNEAADEPASFLLERIRSARSSASADARRKTPKR